MFHQLKDLYQNNLTINWTKARRSHHASRVVVGGLLTAQQDSPVGQMLDRMSRGQFPFVLSPALLDEYRRVLLRPKIRLLYGLDAKAVDALLEEIAANGVFRQSQPCSSAAVPDSGDSHLWGLLATQPGMVLVTGDKVLIENPPGLASVLSPRGFLDLLMAAR